MSMTILPLDGLAQVCELQAETVIPLAVMPGDLDASHYICPSTRQVGVIDKKRKRAGLFSLETAEPWFRKVLPFGNLPKGCIGHTALPFAGGLLVGGHSDSGEALWWRHPTQSPDVWHPLELPAEIRRPGKAIDGLHRLGAWVVAVDNIVVPKWLILYTVTEEPGLTLDRLVRLPHHTTYEHIFSTFLGRSRLWCASRGVNHGRVSSHVWGLELETFREVACLSVSPSRKTPFPTVDDVDERHPLETLSEVVEWEDGLLLPCGPRGLFRATVQRMGESVDSAGFREIAGVDLVDVRAVRLHPDDPALGVFALGFQADGRASHQWVPADRLRA